MYLLSEFSSFCAICEFSDMQKANNEWIFAWVINTIFPNSIYLGIFCVRNIQTTCCCPFRNPFPKKVLDFGQQKEEMVKITGFECYRAIVSCGKSVSIRIALALLRSEIAFNFVWRIRMVRASQRDPRNVSNIS